MRTSSYTSGLTKLRGPLRQSGLTWKQITYGGTQRLAVNELRDGQIDVLLIVDSQNGCWQRPPNCLVLHIQIPAYDSSLLGKMKKREGLK